MRITGKAKIIGGMRIAIPAGPWTPTVPTGHQQQVLPGLADFEMGVWSSGDAGTVPGYIRK
jgi:hypothetical protein